MTLKEYNEKVNETFKTDVKTINTIDAYSLLDNGIVIRFFNGKNKKMNKYKLKWDSSLNYGEIWNLTDDPEGSKAKSFKYKRPFEKAIFNMFGDKLNILK